MKNITTLALAALLSTAPVHGAVTLFSDTFDYSGWGAGDTPANAVWTNSTATNSTASIINGANASFADAYRFNGSSGGVINATFAQATTTDFALTIQLMPQGYSRNLWIGVFNEDGTHGYGFNWDAGTSGIYSGQGTLALREFSSGTPNPTYAYNTSSTLLGSLTSSGHKIDELTGPVDFQLTWSLETRTLTLSLLDTDPEAPSYVTKRSFTFSESADLIESFSRIYIGGNSTTTGVLFDNILVTSSIPEPSSIALLCGAATGCIVLLRRRR